MRLDFGLQIHTSRSEKGEHLLTQSEHAKYERIFFDLRIRRPRSPDFGPNTDDSGHQIFKSKNGVVSKFKILSTTASSSRTINELDGDTAVQRRCFAPDARSAGGAFLRGQTTVGWRGLGPREMHSARTYPWIRTHRLVQRQ